VYFCNERRARSDRLASEGEGSEAGERVTPLFSIQYAPASLDCFGGGDMWQGGGTSDAEAGSDIEDEYVFV
jgi:hypothetical protein